jgi:hypothetical protein
VYSDTIIERRRNTVFPNVPIRMAMDHGCRADIQLSSSLAPETLRKYSNAWVAFKQWLSSYHISNLFSANTQIMYLYTSHLIHLSSQKSIGPNTLEMTLAAISYYFVTAGHVSPTDSALCTYLVRASGRLLSATKSTCEPITAPELHKLLKFHLADNCSLKVRMHLTVLTLMFVGLLRYDDAACILVHADLLQFITKHNSATVDGVLIFIPRSKTDQGCNY